jgi:cytochrome c oxidase assembly protein Cox11
MEIHILFRMPRVTKSREQQCVSVAWQARLLFVLIALFCTMIYTDYAMASLHHTVCDST